MLPRVAVLTLAAMLAFAALADAAAAEPVALTFDDLPAMALDGTPWNAAQTTRRLLAGLHRHRFPAIGFVTGESMEGARRREGQAVLSAWIAAGHELGNHTYSHNSLNHTAVADYIADVGREDATLRPLLRAHGRSLLWFRHPYLETGATLSDKRTFESWLAGAGYRIAPVTMENSDYLFSPLYDDALRRHDRHAAARVRLAYLDYTRRVVPWYREAGLALFGRRPAAVFLLHACRLNADVVDDLAAILKANELQPVALSQALADPAYATPDDYVDPDGDEWLSRWSQLLGRELPWETFPEPPADIAAESARLDPA